jgi:hypothetical protein
MALTIDECLIDQGSGINEMYAGCCCTFQCVVTNPDDKRNISDIQFDFSKIDYTISNFLLDGSAPSYPFTVDKAQQFTIEFTVCAATVKDIEASLYFKLYDQGGTAGLFNFDFITIDTNTSVDVTSIDFSNVPLGSSASFLVTINNPTACCYEYFLSSDCADISFDIAQTNLLCEANKQTEQGVTVFYTPTTLGDLSCTITIESGMCFMLQIPVTGKAVEPVAGGSSNGQKNKVDQTSTVAPCSPRTINNQCNTGATARAAITSRAQTITRPAGGAGRGKGFSK